MIGNKVFLQDFSMSWGKWTRNKNPLEKTCKRVEVCQDITCGKKSRKISSATKNGFNFPQSACLKGKFIVWNFYSFRQNVLKFISVDFIYHLKAHLCIVKYCRLKYT